MLQPLPVPKKWEEDGVRSMYTLNKYMDVLGPSKVKPLMSTEDKNDMCDLDHVTPLISGLTRNLYSTYTNSLRAV